MAKVAVYIFNVNSIRFINVGINYEILYFGFGP